MPVYHSLGKTPRKRHQIFRKGPDGALYTEELMGNMGFVGPSSLLYHVHPPTAIRAVRTLGDVALKPAPARPLKHRHFRTAGLTAPGNRVPLLFNTDVTLSVINAAANAGANTSANAPNTGPFFRNAQADEIAYVSHGAGQMHSPFGTLAFSAGDYLVIPRGIVQQWTFAEAAKLLIIESRGYVRTPKRYRNEYGQLTENAPYSERDIRRPVDLATRDETGDFPVLVKKDNQLVELMYAHHPFDVIGWDGFYYPWAFSIHDFEPRVGRFHLPPPIHQTFDSDNFVVCSFCPRPYDFDSTAVPAPYNHSNVMSDEVLYYANSEFMSRSGIEYGSVTLHPDGLAHGPQPGRTAKSIGQKATDELAVMVDTFHPLHVAEPALAMEDEGYWQSWLAT